MPSVAVLYHSQYGHTKVIAESIVKGVASVDGVAAHLVDADDLKSPGADRQYGPEWDVLNSAETIVFGCPTYMGSVSAGMKRVFEASSGIWYTQGWKNKLAAGFTCSGSLFGDKHNTMQDLATFAAQHSMLWISQGLMPTGRSDTDTNRTGSWLGLHAQADQGKGSDEAPPKGDHETAKAFGARIGEATARWAK
ncbi:MAG: flavodoxin family protein [Planctomycetota bacterium]